MCALTTFVCCAEAEMWPVLGQSSCPTIAPLPSSTRIAMLHAHAPPCRTLKRSKMSLHEFHQAVPPIESGLGATCHGVSSSVARACSIVFFCDHPRTL